MKLLLMLKSLNKIWLTKPAPLSNIANEVAETVKEIKEQNNYTRLVKLITYVVMGILMWIMMYRGHFTMEEIMQLFTFIAGLF